MTLSDRLHLTNGRPAGFDYMRVVLAFMIVVWHTAIVSYGIEAQRSLILGPTRPMWALLLPMFFALSGFLVSGSLERSRTIVGFLGLRVIRLFPALAVESLIAMMVIGPLFTKHALIQYFSDADLWAYMLNMFGIVHYYLPGVFLDNPTPQVNAQLWTLPWELYCYIVISLFYILSLYRSKLLFVAGCAAMQILVIVLIYTRTQVDEGTVRGPVLVLAFLYGSLLYRFRDQIVWSLYLFAACFVIGSFLLYFPVINALAALPIAYATIYLGLLNPTRSSVVSSGDYSYGIFLYGFPIQQAVSATLPGFRYWWLNLIISAPLVFLTAYVSWNFVEKKALLLRSYLRDFELRYALFYDGVVAIYDQAIAAGLKSRWVPKRLQSAIRTQSNNDPGL